MDTETGTIGAPSLVGIPEILSRLPQATLRDVALTKSARSVIEEILKEHRFRTTLLAHDLRPRARLFFFGPPGCGKTLTARALGTSLGVPTFVVRFDALVGSFLGQTGIRLREIFRFAEAQPSVIVIDEIDAVGRHRGRTADVGEVDRIVISLMQQLELVQPATMLIASSNLAEHIDAALLRRFDLAIEFPLPSRSQLTAVAQQKAKARNLKVGRSLRSSLTTASTFAEVDKLIEAEHRRTLLRKV